MRQPVFNFSAGPAMLPVEVLKQAQAEMLDWRGKGMSVMEVSHRGKDFTEMANQSEADLRELLAIPNNYHVLFLAGGATAQFSAIPMNLLTKNKKADYIDTGQWSRKAIKEAERYGEIHIAASVKDDGVLSIPTQDSWSLTPNAAYLHYTPNETIDGVEFHWIPQTGNVPLVADMSSNILSRPINVNDYGIIYAGAQKNMGAAGIGVVIIREDLVKEPMPTTPILYNYQVEVANKSFYNTPPTYNWYLVGLVLAWLKKQGGLSIMAEHNQRKARKLYNFIDAHSFYHNRVAPACRSWMNIPFILQDNQLDGQFLAEAEANGLTNLKGHILAGGMRASIYNAMPEEGVDTLISFMKAFADKHG
ncbi:MAG: phosphoserine aminotransferase [Gammaproteobacteria bacterium]|jgi:phosphoserine aminotransferase|nr:phosphoserine aminotransferase [Gammaproteobacteria bacterium]